MDSYFARICSWWLTLAVLAASSCLCLTVLEPGLPWARCRSRIIILGWIFWTLQTNRNSNEGSRRFHNQGEGHVNLPCLFSIVSEMWEGAFSMIVKSSANLRFELYYRQCRARVTWCSRRTWWRRGWRTAWCWWRTRRRAAAGGATSPRSSAARPRQGSAPSLPCTWAENISCESWYCSFLQSKM